MQSHRASCLAGLLAFTEHIMKRLLTALSVLLGLMALAGCPQSKVPDKPGMVPEPKASTYLQQRHTFEI